METSLKDKLEALCCARAQAHLLNDPLSFPRKYSNKEDIETAALIASSFAYGNIKIILKSLDKIFTVLGDSPSQFIKNLDIGSTIPIFSDFRHRFNDGLDVVALLTSIRYMFEDSGSIEQFFAKGVSNKEKDVTAALNIFSDAILKFDYSEIFRNEAGGTSAGFRFLFPKPASGSACKRLCMYLRWMVRKDDGFDFGLWKCISPSELVIPVDRHIERIGRLIGLTERKSASWLTAKDITESLKKFDPLDPVKYDFSLAHLGISEGCSGKAGFKCSNCPIREFCSAS